MKRLLIALQFVILVGIVPAQLRAARPLQTIKPRLVPGAKVRVTARHATGARFVGRVSEVRRTTLLLDVGGRRDLLELPYSSMSKLEYGYGSPRGPRILKGAGIGILVGTGIGLLVTVSGGESNYFSVTAPLIGAVVGGFAGGIGEDQGWVEIDTPRSDLSLGIGPARHHGFVLSVARRF